MTRAATEPPARPTRSGRATVATGALLVVAYVAVALATDAWAPVRLRPLFDGFASHPGTYRWIKPPEEFAQGNLAPEAAQARVAFDGGTSRAVLAETFDGQAMASVPAGAVPPHQSDTAALVDVTPLDPSTLGPLPPGLRPEGNAYRVSVTYVPSDAALQALSSPGVAGVTSREVSDTLLFSTDGRTWRPAEGKPVAGGRGFTGALTETGYFMAAGRGEPRPLVTSKGGVPVALLLVGAAVPLVLAYLFLSRRRQGEATPSKRSATSRPRSSSKPTRSSRPPTKPKKKKGR
jgi:hypothetical protein